MKYEWFFLALYKTDIYDGRRMIVCALHSKTTYSVVKDLQNRELRNLGNVEDRNLGGVSNAIRATPSRI